MKERQVGKENIDQGTRRDGFFRRPKSPNGFHGKDVLIDKRDGHAEEIRELPKGLVDFIAEMQERATRFDPFPSRWK